MFASHLRDIETADLDHKFGQFSVCFEVIGFREGHAIVLTWAGSVSWQKFKKWLSCQREGKVEFLDAFVSGTWQQCWTMYLENCTVVVLKFLRNQSEETFPSCFFPVCHSPSNIYTYKVCFSELKDFSYFLHFMCLQLGFSSE